MLSDVMFATTCSNFQIFCLKYKESKLKIPYWYSTANIVPSFLASISKHNYSNLTEMGSQTNTEYNRKKGLSTSWQTSYKSVMILLMLNRQERTLDKMCVCTYLIVQNLLGDMEYAMSLNYLCCCLTVLLFYTK